MFEFFKSLFGLSKKHEEEIVISQTKKVYHEHDVIDYDGMGNQGRFPVTERKKDDNAASLSLSI